MAEEYAGPPRRHLVLVAFLALLALTVLGGVVFLVFGNRPPDPDIIGDLVEQPTMDAPRPARLPRERKKGEGAPPLGRPVRLDRLARQVSDIRGIPLRQRLRSRAVSTSALADKISELAFDEQDPEEVANDERLLVALRLAPPDIDLAGILEDLYREQVLGVYVPEEETLYVARDGKVTPGQRSTTAHEITHALQDQAFDIDKLQRRYEDDADAALAVLSLVEGDAVLTQQLWAQEYLSTEEQQQAVSEGGGGEALARAPEYLRESLFFPYQRGGFFVADLYQNGGHAAVDEAFRNPPTSSEQILHPERYRAGDEPVKVTVTRSPGRGWKRATRYAFGEFDLREFLGNLGSGVAAAAGQGWDGGEVRSWSRGGATAVSGVLAFDTPQDADEACGSLPQWYAQAAGGQPIEDGVYAGDRDHLAVRCTADQVHFALAPASQTARFLVAAP